MIERRAPVAISFGMSILVSPGHTGVANPVWTVSRSVVVHDIHLKRTIASIVAIAGADKPHHGSIGRWAARPRERTRGWAGAAARRKWHHARDASVSLKHRKAIEVFKTTFHDSAVFVF